MKVTSVEIYDIQADWYSRWNPVIIRVNTDEGISGLGEVGSAVGGLHTTGVGIAKNMAEQFLIGSDPFKNEQTWDILLRRTFWGLGGGPIIYAGISAIDQALWDIKGKVMGMPVYQLLGGKTNEKIRAYASQIQFGWPVNPQKPAVAPEEYAEEALKAVADGYDALKVDPLFLDDKGRRNGWDLTKVLTNDKLQLIYQRMKAIRDAVGPDIDIILEVHGLLSVTTAIQIGQTMADLKCMYYEEPVNSLNVDAMVKVSQNVKIPIAAGERIYTRWGYRQYLEKQALDVLQPDLCLAGGITEGKKICDMANVYDMSVQCHVCGSPVSIAAALQLEATIPNFIIHEHVSHATLQGNRELVTPDLVTVNGYFDVPDSPGLGIELNEEVIAKYSCIKVT